MERISINNNKFLLELHQYGIDNDVPIIQDEGLDELLNLIDKIKPKRILEIGSAIGYSAIVMALNSNAFIDTIERNEKMYNLAVNNIKAINLEERIKIYKGDAVDFDINELNKDYDLIFIDAAKAQYRRFFLKYEVLLKQDGYIFTDNLSFHGYVEKYHNGTLEGVSKDLRALVRKIDNYNNWLKEYDKYDTTFISKGDGIAISRKK